MNSLIQSGSCGTWRLFQQSSDERQLYTLMRSPVHQRPHIFIHTLIWASYHLQLIKGARLWTLKSHWSSQRKPMQTLGEHAIWTQKGPFSMRGDSANHGTTKFHGLFFYVQVMSFHLCDLCTVLYVGQSCNGGSKVFHLCDTIGNNYEFNGLCAERNWQ